MNDPRCQTIWIEDNIRHFACSDPDPYCLQMSFIIDTFLKLEAKSLDVQDFFEGTACVYLPLIHAMHLIYHRL